ncbi:MAG: hypothetical protein U1C33_06265 [Candidatus Cloacimonadaceae bacterium]|nr:hypothetical protein [Candidatus Cloacimonadaceae bacterium]
MKLIIASFVLVALFVAGCSSDSDKLTKVDINTINVSEDFNYETSRPVDVLISGLFKQTVKIYSMDNELLMRGLVHPINGLHSKITLAYTVKKVRIEYGEESATVDVTDGNYIEHSFLPKN